MYSENLDIVQLLLDRGANIESEVASETPLKAAVKNKQVEMVELLLDRGAIVNNYSNYTTALLMATTEGGATRHCPTLVG